jgi:hypothetical protein
LCGDFDQTLLRNILRVVRIAYGTTSERAQHRPEYRNERVSGAPIAVREAHHRFVNI